MDLLSCPWASGRSTVVIPWPNELKLSRRVIHKGTWPYGDLLEPGPSILGPPGLQKWVTMAFERLQVRIN